MAQNTYGSPVVGYIRSPRLNDPELDVLEEAIRQYASDHGYNLVRVFREEGISSIAAWRPQLENVIRGLERREWAGVLVPTVSHWSKNAAMAERIRRRVEQYGWSLSLQ